MTHYLSIWLPLMIIYSSCVYLCLLNSTLTIHVCANLKSGRWKNKLTKAQTH